MRGPQPLLLHFLPMPDSDRVRIGVSACLLGQTVRYDGGHKLDRFLTGLLGSHVDWVPVCPEVELGLGVPRDTLRLEGNATSPRLVVGRTGEDLTARMRRWAEGRIRRLAPLDLDGYVLKRASPSCGLFGIPVQARAGARSGSGRGIFAEALVRRLPMLPIEEEGRLADAVIRENFVQRVFAAARWRAFVGSRPRARDLVAFHGAEKFTVLAHSPLAYRSLGRLVARGERALGREKLDEYGRMLMEALAVPATRGRHANVLQRLAGHVKRQLSADERAEVAEVIDEYAHARVPLVVPLTLLKHHVRLLGVEDVRAQTYLNPHPKELMLRNHV